MKFRPLRFFLFYIAPLLSIILIISGDYSVVGYILFGSLLVFFLIDGKNYKGEKRILGLSPKWFGEKVHRDDK